MVMHMLLWWCTCCYDTHVAMVMHVLLWYTCVAMVMHMLLWYTCVAMVMHMFLWYTCVAMVMHMFLWYTCVAMVMHMLPPCLPLEWDNCYDPPGHSCRGKGGTQTDRHADILIKSPWQYTTESVLTWLAVTNQKSSLSGTLSSLRSWQ